MFKTLSWIWIVDNLHTTRLVENIIFSREYCFYGLLQYEESIYTRIHSNEEIRRKHNKKDALKYFNSKTREIFFAGNNLFYNTNNFFQSEKQLYFQISTFRGGPNHSPLIWTPAFQWDQWALEIQSDSMGTKNLTSYAWQ